jgi:hypothetical protein
MSHYETDRVSGDEGSSRLVIVAFAMVFAGLLLFALSVLWAGGVLDV